jgi:hypothetical protein
MSTDLISQPLPAQPFNPPNGQLAFIHEAVQTFAGVQKLADVISNMDSAPSHLKGRPADCFRIVAQAVKWRMDPFSVCECTSLVHGRLCYEGKLVAAVLSSMGAIEGRLEYDIQGKGQEASITVTGYPKHGKGAVSISGTVKDWRTVTKNKDGKVIPNAWDSQPETMLVYRGTRQWARIYTPEAILGVYTPDELEVRDVEATVHQDPPLANVDGNEPQDGTPTASDQPKASDKVEPTAKASPHIAEARALWKAANDHQPKYGTTLLDRLCKLHKSKVPKDIPEDRIEQFRKDVAELSNNLAESDAMIAEWERIEAQEGVAK